MPLLRGPGTAAVSGKGIDFVMVNDTGTTVLCMVTQETIDDLANLDSSADFDPPSVKPLRLHMNWQTEIERMASQKYDAGDLTHGMVVIAPHDLLKAGIIP